MKIQIFNHSATWFCSKSSGNPTTARKAIKNLQWRSSKPAKACARISIPHAEKSGLTHKAKTRAQFRLLHLQIATLSMREVLFTSSLLWTQRRSFLHSPSPSHFQPGTRFHTHLLRPNGLYCGQLRRYASSHNRLQSAPDSLRQMDVQVQTMLTNIGALQLGVHAFCSHAYCSFACLKE